MMPRTGSYGETPTVTRSPGTTLMRNGALRPLSWANTSWPASHCTRYNPPLCTRPRTLHVDQIVLAQLLAFLQTTIMPHHASAIDQSTKESSNRAWTGRTARHPPPSERQATSSLINASRLLRRVSPSAGSRRRRGESARPNATRTRPAAPCASRRAARARARPMRTGTTDTPRREAIIPMPDETQSITRVSTGVPRER